MPDSPLKPLIWIGSSLRDLGKLDAAVQDSVGYALYVAQRGERHSSAKVLRGFGGAGVLEVVEDDSAGTYRAVYTVKFASAVYVLHVFQKKSKRGVATPQSEIDLIHSRLATAQAHHEENNP